MTASSESITIDPPVRSDRTPVDQETSISEAQEARWIRAGAAGDQTAFERLMRLHQDRVFCVCLRLLGCRQDALEASQDVFLRVHRALSAYRPEGKFSTWLYQIALNRCRDLWKRKTARLAAASRPLHLISAELPDPGATPDSLASGLETLALIEAKLAALPRKHREIIVLSCIDDLTHAECAEILKCSERAIEGRLYRARKALGKE